MKREGEGEEGERERVSITLLQDSLFPLACYSYSTGPGIHMAVNQPESEGIARGQFMLP